jgi:hypothetical protein
LEDMVKVKTRTPSGCHLTFHTICYRPYDVPIDVVWKTKKLTSSLLGDIKIAPIMGIKGV